MPASRLALILTSLLLLGSGTLMLLLGNPIPLLAAVAGLLLAALLQPRQGGAASAWISTVGAIIIFVSGTPLTGSPPEGLLITAAMAVYFICWVQQLKMAPVSALVPTAPFTLAFYASLLLGYLLLRSRLFPFPYIASILTTVLFILGSLVLWELGRRSRLSQAAQVESPSLPDWLGRVLVLISVLLLTFLLFRLPLPWAAGAALHAAADLGLVADPPSGQRPDNTDWDAQGDGDWRPPEPGEDTGRGEGGEGGSGGVGHPWRRGQLPPQADLDLSAEARLHLQILEEDRAADGADRPHYVRVHAFGLFQHGAWTRLPEQGQWVADAEDGRADGWVTFNAAPPNRAVPQQIYLYNYVAGNPLPVMPNVLAIQEDKVFVQGGDSFSLQRAGDIVYQAASAPVRYADIAPDKPLQPGEAPPYYLAKARGLTFRDIDNTILTEIDQPNRTLREKLAALQLYFERNYTYTTRVENPGKHDPLANFLFHEKRGYCDFYAQAGAHILRRMGVPSRVAYGYSGGLFEPLTAVYTFREQDAHAWTEILLAGWGWTIFDLTPDGQGAHRPAEVQQRGKDDATDPFRRFRQKSQTADDPPEDSFPDRASRVPELEHWLEGMWILRHLDAALGLTVLVLLAAYLYRRWRQRERDEDSGREGRAARGPREPPGYFRDFCELFESLGYRRARGETLREYFGKLREGRLFTNEFDPLLTYHYQVEYENHERSRSTEKQFARQIRDFRKSRASSLEDPAWG